VAIGRPGSVPGRSFIFLLLALLLAVPASAQEVFSWFNRGLLVVAVERGDWVRYAVEEIDEYGAVRDTLTVTVMENGPKVMWLRLESPTTRDFVALDRAQVRPGANLLDAVRRVVHDTPDGLVEEDVQGLRDSALVQRHFSDPFVDPEIVRTALADTLLGEVGIAREKVTLAEERREQVGTVTVVTKLRARAELSRSVPLLGLLRSWTLSEVTTESASSRGRRRPPLTNENALTCIGYGRGSQVALPEGLGNGN